MKNNNYNDEYIYEPYAKYSVDSYIDNSNYDNYNK